MVSREASVSRANPEIQNRGMALGVDQDVGRLNVSVNDARLVRRLKAIGNLADDVECVLDRQRSLGDLVFQRLAFEKGHRQERLAVNLVNLINGANVRVM